MARKDDRRRKYERRIKRATRFKRRRSRSAILTAAALAIPGISLCATASAQSPAQDFVAALKYAEYRDSQDSDDRMRVHSPVLWLKGPAGENAEFEGSLSYESVSGASPLYLSTLSGASGIGIDDERSAGDLHYTKFFENFSLGIGGSVSNEDDYDSAGFVLDSQIWTPSKNTSFAFGAGANFDQIGSTIDQSLDEDRNTANYLLGVTQVVDADSIVLSNVTYESGDGYFSDPYKPFDYRPSSRERWAWLTRYNRYFSDFDAALHADYRFYRDSFGVQAHTFELAWYQPFAEVWLVRPSIRYYSQHKADFFSNSRFPLDTPDGFFSMDQRLSSFGEWGAGLKLQRQLPHGFSVDISVVGFQQRAGFKLGSYGSTGIEPFTGWMLILGAGKTF